MTTSALRLQQAQQLLDENRKLGTRLKLAAQAQEAARAVEDDCMKVIDSYKHTVAEQKVGGAR